MFKGAMGKLVMAVTLTSLLLIPGLATAQIKVTHPRIWITDALLNDLKARAAANSPEWIALKSYADNNLGRNITNASSWGNNYWDFVPT